MNAAWSAVCWTGIWVTELHFFVSTERNGAFEESLFTACTHVQHVHSAFFSSCLTGAEICRYGIYRPTAIHCFMQPFARRRWLFWLFNSLSFTMRLEDIRIVSIYFKGGFNRTKLHCRVSLHLMSLWFSSCSVGVTPKHSQIQSHYGGQVTGYLTLTILLIQTRRKGFQTSTVTLKQWCQTHCIDFIWLLFK